MSMQEFATACLIHRPPKRLPREKIFGISGLHSVGKHIVFLFLNKLPTFKNGRFLRNSGFPDSLKNLEGWQQWIHSSSCDYQLKQLLFDGSSACHLVQGLTTPYDLSNSEAHCSDHWLLHLSHGISYTWPCDSFTFPTWTCWPSCSIQGWFSVPLKPTTWFQSGFRSQGWSLHSLEPPVLLHKMLPHETWKPVLGLWAWEAQLLGAVQGFPCPLWLGLSIWQNKVVKSSGS